MLAEKKYFFYRERYVIFFFHWSQAKTLYVHILCVQYMRYWYWVKNFLAPFAYENYIHVFHSECSMHWMLVALWLHIAWALDSYLVKPSVIPTRFHHIII